MSEDVARKMRRKYMFGDLMFDSSTELAFYIWAMEHGKQIVRSDCALEYVYNGKECRYFPDFYDNDSHRYVEIKGD